MEEADLRAALPDGARSAVQTQSATNTAKFFDAGNIDGAYERLELGNNKAINNTVSALPAKNVERFDFKDLPYPNIAGDSRNQHHHAKG